MRSQAAVFMPLLFEIFLWIAFPLSLISRSKLFSTQISFLVDLCCNISSNSFFRVPGMLIFAFFGFTGHSTSYICLGTARTQLSTKGVISLSRSSTAQSGLTNDSWTICSALMNISSQPVAFIPFLPYHLSDEVEKLLANYYINTWLLLLTGGSVQL